MKSASFLGSSPRVFHVSGLFARQSADHPIAFVRSGEAWAIEFVDCLNAVSGKK